MVLSKLIRLFFHKQELAHIAFTKTKRTRGHERSFSSLNRRTASMARMLAASGGKDESDDNDDGYMLQLPPLDTSIVNPYLLWKYVLSLLPYTSNR